MDRARRVPVEAARVATTTFHKTVRGIGTLEAGETVVISPEVSGIVEQVHFREGARVAQGELLFSIRDDKIRRELQSMQSALASARSRMEQRARTYERFQRLYESRTVSKEERDQAETEFETARAEVNRLEAEVRLVRERLEDTRIKAPLAGVLSETDVDKGDYVENGDALVTLYSLDSLEIAFTVAERYVGDIEEGQPVRVMVDAYPDRNFSGRIIFVSPSVTPQTRSLPVKAVVDNPGNLLRPGKFATVVVTIERRKERPAVPEESLVAVREGYVVFIVGEDNIVQRKPVTVGLREPGKAEILEGVKPGQFIVRSGQMGLSDGDRVRIVSGPDEGKSAPAGAAQ